MSDKLKGIVQLILVCIFIVGSFVVSGLLQTKRTPAGTSSDNERGVFVETQEVTPAPYRISFETTGTVEARANVSVVPQVSGRVVAVNEQFFEGGVFEAQSVLFEIEPKDFELEVQRIKSDIARASTNFKLEQAEAEAAVAEWEQLNGDKKVPYLVARKPQIAETWAALKAAKAQLENAELDLERTKFSLPFDGRVLFSNLEQGQYVSAGQSYGEAFDVGTLEVVASLKDQQLEWLMGSENPDVKITTTYLGQEKTYGGVLKRGASSFGAQTRFATVRFGFAGGVVDLLPGVFVTLTIQGPELQDIALLPAQAMQKNGVVWLVDADGKLKSLTPEIAYADGQFIAVSNIDETVSVVTSRASGATEGTAVLQSDRLSKEGDDE